MQDDDGPMTGIEASERLIEQVVIGHASGDVRAVGCIERFEFDLDDATPTAASQVEAGVDGDPMEPGVESIRVAQPREVAPSSDEGVLDRVARQLWVPEDEAGCGVQAREGQVDKRGEGVMIASPSLFDEPSLVHGPPRCRRGHRGRAS